jgi:hypothetical protein
VKYKIDHGYGRGGVSCEMRKRILSWEECVQDWEG